MQVVTSSLSVLDSDSSDKNGKNVAVSRLKFKAWEKIYSSLSNASKSSIWGNDDATSENNFSVVN